MSVKFYRHNNRNFGLVSKVKSLKDRFYICQFTNSDRNSINRISDVRPIPFAGTTCNGAAPLKNFWNLFTVKATGLNAKYLGLSTNKDGFADSFLKEKANIPLSTSYVHNCSALYLYNDKAKTHALYHASPDCKLDYLKSMVERLMPEGVTRAAIIPGDFIFYREHPHNMKNMLKVIRDYSPKARVNVYHDSTRFPEIVGYKGEVYEIPNKDVMRQMKKDITEVSDHGQASFRILDLQGANTFYDIYSKALSQDSIDKLKDEFSKKKFPALISEIFLNEILEIEKIYKYITKINSLEELDFYNEHYPQKAFKLLFLKKKEDLLLRELEKVNDLEGLQFFYKKARLEFIRMKNLFKLFNQKKEEIL